MPTDYIAKHQAKCPTETCAHIWCYVCRYWFDPDGVQCRHASRYPSAQFADWARRKARLKADRAEFNLLRARGLASRHAQKLANLRKDTP